ncbi:hypothetical protein SLEP1_g42655 [Rubroshorea leprosula]|uniref:PRP1 splicing factor N-terminal domain-containing protein n=1 Tax=Rubroshorea leprosula TaxID=152421 RepID=A0AAV5LBK0_9ROSI|nr:hypothetical protein SLEP1_g42655 [Rubroshorea leprosula]
MGYAHLKISNLQTDSRSISLTFAAHALLLPCTKRKLFEKTAKSRANPWFSVSSIPNSKTLYRKVDPKFANPGYSRLSPPSCNPFSIVPKSQFLTSSPKPRLDFLNSKLPPNYVAGLRHGATGFTTRSDIGPARLFTSDLPYRSTVAASGSGRGKPEEDEEEDEFDDYQGNDGGLFASTKYGEDNREADAIWGDGFEDERSKRGQKQEETIPEFCTSSRYLSGERKVGAGTCYGSGPKEPGCRRNGNPLGPNTSGITVVDPKSYLTDLKSMEKTSCAELSHIKKPRLLLKSVIQTNHKHPPGWIPSAGLEEEVGKIQAARQLIQKGCEEYPKIEDMWLEACRLAKPDDAKAVIARGVKSVPNSVKLRLQGVKLEHDDVNKSRVLRKGLEQIPDSVRLWKAVVELAKEEDARLLLHRVVECCLLHVELWLALAKLETYDMRRRFLTRPEKSCLRSLREGLVIDREVWMKEAEAAERAGYVATCLAIIHNTIGIGVEKEHRKRNWDADVVECKKRGSMETTRSIYAHALMVFLTKKSIWLKAAQPEKGHGTKESLDALLHKAVTYRPQDEVLWLMGAEEKWLAGVLPVARAILQEAYAAIPIQRRHGLQLLSSNLRIMNLREQERTLVAKALEGGGTERAWMKLAIVERELGNIEEERSLDEGLTRILSFFKLWLMLGQLEERLEKMNGIAKACAVLTLARKKNPQQPEIWLAAARTKSRQWSQRKSKSVDAFTKFEKDPHVVAAVAKLFYEREVDKARSYLHQAVTLAPDISGFWALYYKFELQHGNEENLKDVLQRCVAAEPKHGEKWQAISNAVENSHQPNEATFMKVVVAPSKEESDAAETYGGCTGILKTCWVLFTKPNQNRERERRKKWRQNSTKQALKRERKRYAPRVFSSPSMFLSFFVFPLRFPIQTIDLCLFGCRENDPSCERKRFFEFHS